MPTLTESLIATLQQEHSIIEQLIQDAHELREALSTRDGSTIQVLVQRRQSSITRLQMVQHAKTSILKKNSTQKVHSGNVRNLIMEMAPRKAAPILENLQQALVLLHQLNQVNDRLLVKHRASVNSYNHLVDMALGVEQTYTINGSIQTQNPAHLEQHG